MGQIKIPAYFKAYLLWCDNIICALHCISHAALVVFHRVLLLNLMASDRVNAPGPTFTRQTLFACAVSVVWELVTVPSPQKCWNSRQGRLFLSALKSLGQVPHS